jgi:hypothetical protein
MGDWSFAGWSDGDVIYTMAANAPMEKLKQFVARWRVESAAAKLTAGQPSGLRKAARS